MSSEKIRLQKYLSRAGVASRRKGEQLILEGKVAVNDRVVSRLGTRIDPKQDSVTVEGRCIIPPERIYLLLNKPVGYLCSLKDRFGRPLVIDLLKDLPVRIFPVGRLDLNSEGLLLLTNDGEFSQMLTHPRHEVEKTYRVDLQKPLSENRRDQLEKGVVLEDGDRTRPAKITVLSRDRRKIAVTIREGKKRQVRRMMFAVGNEVLSLKRTTIGPLKLGRLPRGSWRELSPREVSALKSAAKET